MAGPPRTDHDVLVGDARSMAALADDSVELVVTSPPYPMIEMWDGTFAELEPAVGEALRAGDGWVAFEHMHAALDAVWDEVARVLAPGGIACVNVGDATRSVDGGFACYPNHARILTALVDRGLDPLPGVLWRKPTNSVTKFMGSGTLPPNAYVTLEHEHILVCRNGGPRSFPPGDDRRYESAFFWEERNEWFSDCWTDLVGARQAMADDEPRERAAAFPFEVPFRLVNMYSVRGDTVLDPFWGTGTTTLAAMVAARDSVGYELDAEFRSVFEGRLEGLPARSWAVQRNRLAAHRAFVETRREGGDPPGHDAEPLGVPVVTSQETRLTLYAVETVTADGDGYVATHVPVGTDSSAGAEPDPGRG